jgi:geranylgeranyl diphosphate synthase type II
MVELEREKIMTENPYKNFSITFDNYFNQAVNQFAKAPENLYQPLTYFLALGGKRVRPLLTLIASDFFNGDVTNCLPAATSIELFHNFSLIHDDIMDNAPLRRNKQTVHEKWNNSVAILSGDVLMVKAYQELAKIDKKIAVELQTIFSKMAVEVCEGQQLDMDFETKNNVTISEYINMIRLKTAVLLGCSLQMGAICANASQKDNELLYQTGEKLGIAFQLTDDYLDAFGNPDQVGKQVGGDIISNKKTWLLLKAFELANATQKNKLQSWLTKKDFNTSEKVQAVKEIFTSLKIKDYLKTEIDTYYNEAINLLKSSSASSEKINVFAKFAQSLMQRTK